VLRSPRRLVKLSAAALLAVAVGFLAASSFVEQRYAERIVRAASAPEAPMAIVFGAGLEAGSEPSPILAERLDAAIVLYKSGRVKQLLLSGDSSDRRHDETRAMKRYVVDRGLPAEAALEDPAGISTYDTCYRAGATFGVKRALLVTQEFHLPRALFIAESLGIEAWGVAADEEHPGHSAYEVRELFSRPLALVMVTLRPAPRESR
jgi:vancomycin permeability regulator SanA